jgi:hypothetical protein
MNKYGVQQRVGERFVEEVDDIKIERIKNKKSKEKPSTKTISNLIVRHKNFKKIKEDIIYLEEEKLNEEE